MFADHSRPAAQFLARQPWFTQLPADMQARIEARVSLRAGRKGEVMLHAGEPVKGWYAVTAGLVTLQSQSAQGRLSVFLGAQAGDWFGEGSALKNEPRRYDVIALRDSELLCLPRAEFDELRATSLAFNQLLVAHLNLRLGQAMAMIEAERIRSPEQRVALYLGRLFWPGLRKLRLSQEELANLVGLSRQTVNRVLKQFEAQGLVSLEFGRIGIADEAALAERAGTRP
ncbi:MAG: Crp/Fnr family transcriptional regulator [Ramlibacter sp.]|nr:Crp/Fnr family transcriptional regulator [Ramlibacter sp.]